jgi:hypothetical protein
VLAHKACLAKWLALSRLCPCCRHALLLPGEGETHRPAAVSRDHDAAAATEDGGAAAANRGGLFVGTTTATIRTTTRRFFVVSTTATIRTRRRFRTRGPIMVCSAA